MKLRKSASVCLGFMGDGATSQGDFHNAMNFAAVFDVGCIFLCQNNGWAISLPVERQTRSESIAEKAIAYGMPGVLVDGNDVFAVYQATAAAGERARSGGGPTLIECLSYRLGDHTTADDATRYRPAEEVKQAWREEPVARLQAFLVSQGVWNAQREQALVGECQAEVQRAVETFEATPVPPAEAALEHVYGQWPQALAEQREWLRERAARREVDHE